MATRTLRTVLIALLGLTLLACNGSEPVAGDGKAPATLNGIHGTVQVAVENAAAKAVGEAVAPVVTAPAKAPITVNHGTWAADKYKPTDGSEWVVNAYTTSIQSQADVSCNRAVDNWFYGAGTGYLAKGKCVATWQSLNQAGGTSNYDVYVRSLWNVQYYNDANTARDVYDGDPALANTTITDTQDSARVAITPNNVNGGYVVVWKSSNQTGDNGDGIYAQRFDKAGAKILTGGVNEFHVNTFTTNQQNKPDVAMDNNGNFVVAWQAMGPADENLYGIYARKYDSNGSPTAEIHVNQYTTANQSDPAVAFAEDGSFFVVVWTSAGQDGDGSGVYARKFAADGTALTDEVKVNATTALSQQYADVGISVLDGAPATYKVVVTWEGDTVGNGFDVWFQILNPDTLAAAGAETTANVTVASDQRYPAIAVNPGDATFTIAWQSNLQDGANYGVYHRRFSAVGSPLNDELGNADVATNLTYTNGDQANVAIATVKKEGTSATPSFVIAWDSAVGDGNNLGVFARRYSIDDDEGGDGRGYDGDNCKAKKTVDGAGAFLSPDADNDLLGDACDNCAGADTAGATPQSCKKPGKKNDANVIQYQTYCTNTENFDQADADGDLVGDVCDNCSASANGGDFISYDASVNVDTTQVDYDLDGIGDKCDTDDDADTVPDVDEGGTAGDGNLDGDFDHDSTAPWIARHDTDSDGDGISDTTEYAALCDNDNVPGEAAPHDCDGDFGQVGNNKGLNNYDTDADADDIPDSFEGVANGDNDPYPNYVDGDSNSDLITDFRAVHNVDGTLLGSPLFDADADTFADNIDADRDGDGITDAVENGNGAECFPALGAETSRDSDGDKLWNWQDLDSDNDGIADSIELKYDEDVDGYCAFVDGDSDGDNITDAKESGSSIPANLTDVYCWALQGKTGNAPANTRKDCDGDGKINSQDTDVDGDGILDILEANTTCDPGISGYAGDNKNCDGDAYENWFDADSDGDGIADAHEAGTNDAGDHMPSAMNGGTGSICVVPGDGLVTKFGGGTLALTRNWQDCDGDNILNSQDRDADADGVYDSIELVGNIEPSPDAAENWFDGDSDGDEVADSYESGKDRVNCPAVWPGHKGGAGYHVTACDGILGSVIPQDIDGDGTVNSLDFDSDGDGIKDWYENNNAGTAPAGMDTDADGIANWWDLDSDKDWIADEHESGSGYLYIQHDNEGHYLVGDYDNDGILNAFDTDSDADGVSDYTEWKNGDGTKDIDGDGLENWVDDDSDADGIEDKHEAGGTMPAAIDPAVNVQSACVGSTAAPGTFLVAPFLDAKFQDCDDDGIVNSQDPDQDGDGVLDSIEWANQAVKDFDGDGAESWFDKDSDGDTLLDAHEAGNDIPGTLTHPYCQGLMFNPKHGVASRTDCDGDGFVNSLDTDADGDLIADSDELADKTEIQLDCMEVPVNDNREAWFDDDTDGDGILDWQESAADSDGDGTKNYKDCDSDADGIADQTETGADADGDGIFNAIDTDADQDGILDIHECPSDADLLAGKTCKDAAKGYSWTPNNMDADGLADYLDEDTDGDGIEDKHENGSTMPTTLTDAHCDKITAGALKADCDKDGKENFRDTDSDADGVLDAIEWANELLADTADGTINANQTTKVERDLDADGFEAWFDNDSDGDGISDKTEAANDTSVAVVGPPALLADDYDRDGFISPLDLDADGDTIKDQFECIQGGIGKKVGVVCECAADTCSTIAGIPLDSERTFPAGVASPDGVKDYLDLDSDGDGYSDAVEAGDALLATNPIDTSADGWMDYLDLDSDGDGFADGPGGGKDNCRLEINPDQTDSDGDAIGNSCDPDYHTCVKTDGVTDVSDITLTITSPTAFQNFDALAASTYNLPVAFTVAGSNVFGLRVYIDSVLYKYESSIPASPYTVTVPFGQHTVSLAVTDEFGVAYNGCEKARASVLVRIKKNCTIDGDCDDGNICSNQSCTAGKCTFAGDPTHAQCCNGDYECGYYAQCADRLPKNAHDGVKECIACDADDPFTPAANCAKQQCKQATCDTATYTCGFSTISTCCFTDIQCGNYPCEKCDVDPITQVGACVANPDAPGGAGCCVKNVGAKGTPNYGCDDADPCTVGACIGNICRQGPAFYGCCSNDGVCNQAGKINVCNGMLGECAKNDSLFKNNGTKCTSNAQCTAAPYTKCADGYCSMTCAADGDCVANVDFNKCLVIAGADKACGAEVGACDYSSDTPDCCTTNTDCIRALIDGKIVGKTYPEFLGTCTVATNTCVFTANVNACTTPNDESPMPEFTGKQLTLVISELMVDPVAVPDDKGEWIELFNASKAAIDINGMFIDDGSNFASANKIDNGTTPLLVNPGKGIILCANKDLAQNGGLDCQYQYGAVIALGDSDTISLWDANGVIIDKVTWTNAVVNAGYSTGLSHPYADNTNGTGAVGTHWFGKGKNARQKYNGSDYGTPGKLNTDIVDNTFTWAAKTDGKPCTIDICHINAVNYAAHINTQGCCTLADGAGGSAQCSDGNACTLDTCSVASNTCDNTQAVANCCNLDGDCGNWYPGTLDYNKDFNGDGVVNGTDADSIKKAFDEVADKKCIAHACRYRKSPNAPGGCIMTSYGLSEFACNDNNPCTKDQCVCDVGVCADGLIGTGYQKCKFDVPVTPGDKCCYNDTQAQTACDDAKPETLNQCEEFKDGAPWYKCKNPVDKDFCDATHPCVDDGKVCTTESCDLGTNKCTHEAAAGCCNTSSECADLFAYTIDLCCTGDAQAVPNNPTLNAMCAGSGGTPGSPKCVHKTGEGFCDTALDCDGVKPAAKGCLTSYCVGHKCRYGTPLLQAKCCVPGTDTCNDANDCTADSCVAGGLPGLGACSNNPDPQKPGCCATSTDCTDSNPADCTTYSCQFDGAYKKCKAIDKLELGLCCMQNSDCVESPDNECTINTCSSHQCRTTMAYAGCCTVDTSCPVSGDQCAVRYCNTQAPKTCDIKAIANCTANLPYLQPFEFVNKPYYEDYTDVSVLGWTTEDVSGSAKANWKPSSAAGLLGSDKHLRFAAEADLTNFDTCVSLPKLNTLGQKKAVVGWWNGLHVGTGQAAGIELRVDARKTAGAWTNQWKLSNITAEQAAKDYYIDLQQTVLESATTEVRFCITTTSLKAGGYWAIDDVKVVRGQKPTLVTTLTDKVIAKGASGKLFDNIDAVDLDYDSVFFSLVNAPSWVTLDDFHLAPVGTINHTYVDVLVNSAQCSGSPTVYPITLKVSDGYLNVYSSFNLTVSGCTGP
jgi:hypothetical protein